MSLKDRNARAENKNRTAVTPKENMFDINILRGMVPADSVRGAVPRETGMDINEQRGLVAAPWASGMHDPEPQTPHCTAITKKGEPCKAAPITGTYLCIGHSRATVGA